MSSIFSDPFFRRGTTLLSGEPIEREGNPAVPVAGTGVVGAVKVFQDVNPYDGTRYSNRLVYCVAARYKGSTVTDASTVAGRLYVFDATRALTEFQNQATTTNATAGIAIGVLDEYLTGELRQDDIVWLVVKGPTSIQRTAAAVNAGAAVQPSTTPGSIQAGTSPVIGQCIESANTSASAGATRINLVSDDI